MQIAKFYFFMFSYDGRFVIKANVFHLYVSPQKEPAYWLKHMIVLKIVLFTRQGEHSELALLEFDSCCS